MKPFAKTAISLVFGGILLYVALSHFGVEQTITSVRQSQPIPLLSGVLLMILAYTLRAARWPIWEGSLTYWDSLRLILIGFMGNNILPARLGEILRAHCTSSKTSDDRGRTTALASVSAERILDGLILGVIGIIGIAFVPLDRQLKYGLSFVSLVLAALALGLVLSIRSSGKLHSLVAAASRNFPGHIPAYAREKAMQFIDGFLPLRTPTRMLQALVASTLIWAVEIASYFCFGAAVWRGMTVEIALIFVVVVNFSSLIPLTIGGIGSIEAAAPIFLVSSGVPGYSAALAMVLMQHGSQYLFTTITGAVFYLTGGFHRISVSSPKQPVVHDSACSPVSTIVEDTRSALGEISSTLGLKPPPPSDIMLSIIVPAYNEQARLPRTILETIGWCSRHGINFEIIVSDDGSKDQTLALGRLFEERDIRIRTLACPHMGKGAAVRFGMLNSKGRYVLFMDADGATPLGEIPRLVNAIEQGHDVAIGSRVAQNPGEVEVKTSLHRRLIGRCFALFVNLFAFGGIGDTQCGFKMFRREAALAIFSRQRTVGFAFDVEILYIARLLSLSIIEVPVNWFAQPGSKVNLVIDSIKMFWDICRIKWLHRKSESPVVMAEDRELSI